MFNVLLEGFFINGILAILIASFITAPLGSVMIWNRLSYVGDSIAHSSLLGVGISIMFHMNMSIGVLLVAFSLAIAVSFAIDKEHSSDTILNIMTSVVMSVGMILLSFMPLSGEQIIHSLFGDIFMISNRDLFEMLLVSLMGVSVLVLRWKHWIMASISSDLSLSSGLNIRYIKTEILVVSALAVVLFSRFVGILLITAFLIIPASAARVISKTPAHMVLISVVVSSISGVMGLVLSASFDTFPGPMTIITSFSFLLLAHLFKKLVCKN